MSRPQERLAAKPEEFEYRVPPGWRACFIAIAVPAFSFGIFPWYFFIKNGLGFDLWPMLVLAIFTGLPLFIGSSLTYFALRIIRFGKKGEQIVRTVSVLGMEKAQVIDFERLV